MYDAATVAQDRVKATSWKLPAQVHSTWKESEEKKFENKTVNVSNREVRMHDALMQNYVLPKLDNARYRAPVTSSSGAPRLPQDEQQYLWLPLGAVTQRLTKKVAASGDLTR